jgi:hypothetical protein
VIWRPRADAAKQYTSPLAKGQAAPSDGVRQDFLATRCGESSRPEVAVRSPSEGQRPGKRLRGPSFPAQRANRSPQGNRWPVGPSRPHTTNPVTRALPFAGRSDGPSARTTDDSIPLPEILAVSNDGDSSPRPREPPRYAPAERQAWRKGSARAMRRGLAGPAGRGSRTRLSRSPTTNGPPKPRCRR